MRDNTTVIICCAGMGTRLGIGNTKSLINICGKPLITHQLEMLTNISDVRIVVGFQAESVIEIANNTRKNIMYAFNYDYDRTGTLYSMSKAMINPKEYVLIIGGDILVRPVDMEKMLNLNHEFVAYSNVTSKEPVFVHVNEMDEAISFATDIGTKEWAGIAKIKSKRFNVKYHFVYEMLEKHLPLPAEKIQSVDIDTPEDYEYAIEWVEENYNGDQL